MRQLSDEELANIAHDYYLSKLNIAEIGKKFGLSRYLIDKALELAEDKGIVKINIYQSVKQNAQLERDFKRLFNLKNVFILENQDTKNQDNEEIVSFAAKQLQSYANSAHTIALTWGTLVQDIINNFDQEDRTDLTFVQPLGQVIRSDKNKYPLVQGAADKFNANCLTLPAPLYAANPALVQALHEEPFYQNLQNYYKKIDLIFTNVGTSQSLESDQFFMKYYNEEVFAGIDRSKIAGIIFGRPFDINGNFFAQIDEHICGISLNDLMKIPKRFLVVKNRFKEDALLGALRSGLITHLVTNSGIAERVLQKNETENN
ncbi:sugar-binding domain-containing protein [Lactobacillus sp. ESL0791]|uniref:sugar-binding transcriptional regulator n=1 Tax=Lactobacillus sp. ESL0791 TaxID=2983234 RepID=UPI0023F7BD5C|nr:sugar-binding domain-containing protein [Lactobacillus sp. ESL0791]MDF7638985.1 sugar-binding domain-containing protein [Lactobacillus sp. ESL0791]